MIEIHHICRIFYTTILTRFVFKRINERHQHFSSANVFIVVELFMSIIVSLITLSTLL